MQVKDYYPYLMLAGMLLVVLVPPTVPPAPAEFGSISQPPSPVVLPLPQEGASPRAAKTPK